MTNEEKLYRIENHIKTEGAKREEAEEFLDFTLCSIKYLNDNTWLTEVGLQEFFERFEKHFEIKIEDIDMKISFDMIEKYQVRVQLKREIRITNHPLSESIHENKDFYEEYNIAAEGLTVVLKEGVEGIIQLIDADYKLELSVPKIFAFDIEFHSEEELHEKYIFMKIEDYNEMFDLEIEDGE